MRIKGIFAGLSLLLSVHAADKDWPVYLGDKASSHFSELKQINRENVHLLREAWIYRSGDARKDNRSQIQCNPIIVDGVMYATSPQMKLLAIDAGTGREIWRFDPFTGKEAGQVGVNRGVVYWSDGKQKRIFYC